MDSAPAKGSIAIFACFQVLTIEMMRAWVRDFLEASAAGPPFKHSRRPQRPTVKRSSPLTAKPVAQPIRFHTD
jgi:hypothetical protein